MIIKTAEFVKSIGKTSQKLDNALPEFAFVGRSNVGKSSLINSLTNRKKLAKTSQTPGRTRLINIFLINNAFYFVDLPGYGFALAGKKEQAEWQQLIGSYFETCKNLKRVFVLVDSRILPTEKDKQMLEYLYYYNIPFSIVATKIDKLSKNELGKNITKIASALGVGVDDIIKVSNKDRKNIEELLDLIGTLV